MELLAPAGNLDKLKIAINYGANAVYLAGQQFGLRSAADNFSRNELMEAVTFAHANAAKVYVAINAKFHDKDFQDLHDFLLYIEDIKVDAVICSDLGVIKTVRETTQLKIHVSTQASVLNQYHAQLYKQAGATRIVLGREVSLKEAVEIKEYTGLEIEMFVHGAMCMSYSGHCTLSNYIAGRDANRGGCLQNCRHHFTLKSNDSEIKTTFLSSKDLNTLPYLDSFRKAGIDSLKIEGRMKSQLYVASVTRAYAQSINELRQNRPIDNYWQEELYKLPYRGYTEASLNHPAGENSVYDASDPYDSEFELAGSIIEVSEDKQKYALLCKSQIRTGIEIEIMPFNNKTIVQKIGELKNTQNKTISMSQPSKIVWLPYIKGIEKGNIVRFNSKLFPRISKSKKAV